MMSHALIVFVCVCVCVCCATNYLVWSRAPPARPREVGAGARNVCRHETQGMRRTHETQNMCGCDQHHVVVRMNYPEDNTCTATASTFLAA